jgi:hypothetical protein
MPIDLKTFHGWLLLSHIVPGFAGLIAFWFPVVLKKGSRAHIVTGKVFAICCGLVALSAIIASLWMLISPMTHDPRLATLDPAKLPGELRGRMFVGTLLGALGLYTLVPLILSMRWVDAKKDPGAMQKGWLRGLVSVEIIVSGAVMALGIANAIRIGPMSWWLISLLGLAGLQASIKHARDCFETSPLRMQWWYRHMEYTLTCGIAFHTAFFVFGASRFGLAGFTGYTALIPWLAPSLIGIPATRLWIGYYQRKFGDR